MKAVKVQHAEPVTVQGLIDRRAIDVDAMLADYQTWQENMVNAGYRPDRAIAAILSLEQCKQQLLNAERQFRMRTQAIRENAELAWYTVKGD